MRIAARIAGDESRSELKPRCVMTRSFGGSFASRPSPSGALAQERDLAQEIAGSERGDGLAIAFDPDPAVDDQEELLRKVALAHQRVAIGDVDLVGQPA